MVYRPTFTGRAINLTDIKVKQRCYILTIHCAVRYPVRPHTLVSPSADSKRVVVSYWRKYVHEVLVNRLRGLSLS